MKINSIQNNSYRAYNSTSGANSKNPAFRGTFLINCWDAIERGGFASSFAIQDICGSCIPRTAFALNRNKEITHKTNYLAAGETAIREVLTGPGMVAIPMIVLAAANKFSGSTNSVPVENIEPFSEEMKKILKSIPFDSKNSSGYAASVKRSFYERAFSLMLGEEEGNISDAAKNLADYLMRYDNKSTPKRNFFQQLLNKDIVKNGTKVEAKDQIYSLILTKFTDAKKGNVDTFDTLLFSNMNGKLNKQNKVSSLVKDISNFGQDIEKTIIKKTKSGTLPDFMDAFKQKRIGSKFITNALMVIGTAIFLTQIPKLYTLSKTNPDTDAFRNENKEANCANK